MGLFQPKHIPYEDDLSRSKFLLIWRICLIGIVLLTTLTILFWSKDTSAKWTYLISACIAATGFLYILLTRKFAAVFFLFAIAGSVLLHIDSNINYDTPHHANFLWIILFIVIAFFGAGIKFGFFIFAVNALAIIFYSYYSLGNYFHVPKILSKFDALAIGIEMIAVIFFAGYIMYIVIRARNKMLEKLIESNQNLEKINEEVQKRSNENEILVKEIHHRVKNNLQIIISLLRLQMSEVKTKESKNHFSEAVNRVMVMSSIHQKLYQENNLTDFKLDEYIRDLAQELKLFFLEEYPVKISVKASVKDLNLKTIVPLGLLLNELISNSLKYAFETINSGEINIRVEEKEGELLLSYSDNGVWSESKKESGFGLELIQVLTEQLNGSYSINKEDSGTFYTFQLNPDLHEKK